MDKIRDLIAKGKVDDALHDLLAIVKKDFPDFEDEIIMISKRYHYAKEKSLDPLENKMILHVLEVIRIIEEYNPSISSEMEAESTKEQHSAGQGKLVKIFTNNALDYNVYWKEDLRVLIKNKLDLLQKHQEGVSLDQIKNQIKNHIDTLRQINEDELHLTKSDLGRVDFVNRRKEIDRIETSTGKTEYWLIDAPAGYGKTELLKELSSRFKPGKTICLFIQISAEDDLPDVLKKFLDIFDLPDYPNQANEQNFGLTLYENLHRKYGTDLQTKDLTLFIDFDGKSSKHFALFQSMVIPFFWDSLKRNSHFILNPEAFKVVYAGRNLSKHLLKLDQPPVIRPIPLSDFDLENVISTVRNHTNAPGPVLGEISADILFLTGGHPLAIAKALSTLGNFGPRYLRDQKDQVYDLINLIVENIEFETLSEDLSLDKADNLAKDLWFFPVLQACSVFRLITLDILAEFKLLFQEIDLPQAVPMERRLKNSLLWLPLRLTNKVSLPGVLQDGIARKVLNINLRQRHPQKYKHYCEFAKKCCFDRITEGNKLPSSLWLIEYLFQSLQIQALDIDSIDSRHHINADFYGNSGDLARGITSYISTLSAYEQQNLDYEAEKIITAIKEDEEFKFMLKYYLREKDGIDEAPMIKFETKFKAKFLNNK